MPNYIFSLSKLINQRGALPALFVGNPFYIAKKRKKVVWVFSPEKNRFYKMNGSGKPLESPQ